MVEKRFLQTIQITHLSEAAPFFMQLKLTFDTGETRHIKFQLDSITYNNLKKVITPVCLKGNILKSMFTIPVNHQYTTSSQKAEWVLWELFGHNFKFSFACSEEFKLFLNKLRTIESMEQYNKTLLKKEDPPKPKIKRNSLFRIVPITAFIIFFLFGSSSASLVNYQPNMVSESNFVAVDEVIKDQEKLIAANFVPENPEEAVPVAIVSLPEGQIALTFDDGPTVFTQDILKVLHEYEVPVTFFFLGNNINRFPKAVYEALEQGHAVGLHSFAHKSMIDLSLEEQALDVQLCVDAINPYVEKVSLYRPPYGAYNANTKEVLANYNMSLALWNRDPKDWNAATSNQIVDAVLNSAPSGGIYVMHENAKTLEALPQIIEAIRKMELEFVVLGNNKATYTALSM